MALSRVGHGTFGTGAATTTPGTPAGTQAGDLAIVFIVDRHATITTTPTVATGWSQVGTPTVVGTGSQGADVGQLMISVQARILPAAYSSQSFTLTGGLMMLSIADVYRSAANETFELDLKYISDTAPGTNLNGTASGSNGFTVGDMVAAFGAVPTDAATFTSMSIAATGATIGSLTGRLQATTTTGNDGSAALYGGTVSAGTQTAAATSTTVLSASTTGGIALLRIRAGTANAGADVASHTINTAFSRTGTTNFTASSHAWTIQSGPAGVGTTIGTAAALSWTPTVAGTYVLRYAATNQWGTAYDELTITVAGGGGGGGAVAVGSFSTGSNSAGASFTVGVPSGTVNGEYLLAFCGTDTDATTPFIVASGGGWAELTDASGSGISGVDAAPECRIYGKVANNESGSYSFATTGSTDGQVHVVRFTGVDTSNPILVGPTWARGTPATAIPAPSVSPAVAGGLVIFYASINAGTYTPPAGMSEIFDTIHPGAWFSSAAAFEMLAAGGATGTRTATHSTSDDYTVASLVLRPAAGAVISTLPLVRPINRFIPLLVR